MSRDTLAAPARHDVVIRHSRFLAQAFPVDDGAAAMAAIAGASDVEATHNCWGWRCGGEHRSSDDGEPGGTAGRPILAAIDGQGFDRVAVVVTRWYGGTKLGAGGLVRAYGGTAAECLRTAPRLLLVDEADFVLHAPFEDLGQVHLALDAFGAAKGEAAFDAAGARLPVRIAADRAADLKIRLRDATRNRVRMESAG